MTMLFATLIVLAGVPSTAPNDGRLELQAEEMQVETTALKWLELLDSDDWAGTYALTSAKFRRVNTQEIWAEASEAVRSEFGKTGKRELQSNQAPPTPEGYRVLAFRTHYSNREETELETITLVKEGSDWKVVGIFIE